MRERRREETRWEPCWWRCWEGRGQEAALLERGMSQFPEHSRISGRAFQAEGRMSAKALGTGTSQGADS